VIPVSDSPLRAPIAAGRSILLCRLAVLLLCLFAAACAPFRPEIVPMPTGSEATGANVARVALTQVGAPYRYGGAAPGTGFDCSGLVHYAFGVQGIVVPRTAAQQYGAARPISFGELRPGDLVFFRLAPPSPDVTHVGIYTGQGRFVHSPKSGRRVCETSLDDEFFRARLAGYGRLGAP
jgi:cell wall-associated NlpC family hydrolase